MLLRACGTAPSRAPESAERFDGKISESNYGRSRSRPSSPREDPALPGSVSPA
jgi:hypothetical protein